MSPQPAQAQPAAAGPSLVPVTTTQLGQADTASVSSPAMVNPPTAPAPQTDNYLGQMADLHKQVADYHTFGEKHPHWSAFLGVQTSPQDDAFLAGVKRKAEALTTMHQAQQEAAVNKTFKTNFNKVAAHYGLEQMPEVATLDPKTWLELLHSTGRQDAANAIADVSARNRQIEAENQIIGKKKLAYIGRLNDPTISPQEKATLIKQGEPQFMKLLPMPAVVNHFIAPSEISPLVTANTESSKVGSEAGSNMVTNATNEQSAKEKLGELHNQLENQKQVHQDTIAQQNKTLDQTERHFQAGQGLKTQEFEEKKHGDMHNRYLQEYKDSETQLNKARKATFDANTALENIGKDYHSNGHGMMSDPRYAPAYAAWAKASAEEQAAQLKAAESTKKLSNFEKLTGQTGQPAAEPPQPTAPVYSQSKGQTIKTPAMPKIPGNARTLDLFKRLHQQ